MNFRRTQRINNDPIDGVVMGQFRGVGSLYLCPFSYAHTDGKEVDRWNPRPYCALVSSDQVGQLRVEDHMEMDVEKTS